MNFGENIYFQRSRLNLSQGDLADSLGVSRQSISKWENNCAVPELDKLIRMSELFDLSLDELVYGKKEAHQEEKKEETPAISAQQPIRVTIGLIMLIFGLVGFLLSVFWGDRLRVGEEVGEIVSISIVLLSVAIIATYNFKIFGFCSAISFIYSLISFGFLNFANVQNYLFISLTNLVILVWFIVMGTHLNKENHEKAKPKNE